MAPGRLRASSRKSCKFFHGASTRTASTVGSAVKRAIGRKSANAKVGVRPSRLSASGITVNDEPRTFPDPITVAGLIAHLGKDATKLAVEVNRLENAADDVHDEALSRLFEEEKDAITVIKWKEVLDLLEEATDRCEDCANVLESVVVKHG